MVSQSKIIQVEPDVPVIETYDYLSKFPKFSLIEKIEPKFYRTAVQASIAIAKQIRQTIIEKTKDGKMCVLGLATGSSPKGVYRQLVRMHKEEGLSFKNVVTFNLDEYYPILPENKNSYYFFMRENLFKHIDILPENINIPSGEIAKEQVVKFCTNYEHKINSYGGIDLQILGIGRTGHIGFNEPPSPINSITRLVYLHRITRKDAAPAFGGYENVPKCALTMGIASIKKAKKIIIMAWGESKASVVKRSMEGEHSNEVPSTFLQFHQNSFFYLDKAASEQLTRFEQPWVIRGDLEDPVVPKSLYWILKSIIWLSDKVGKPILRLTADDYEDHNLSSLVMNCASGEAQRLNLFVYRNLISKITGWPLGDRPVDANRRLDDSRLSTINASSLSELPQMKKEESSNAQEPISSRSIYEIPHTATKAKNVLIFSPHPDDDVICMAGSMKKMYEQGHNIFVAYMVSGSNAVHDGEAEKYLNFLDDFTRENLIQKAEKKEEQLALNGLTGAIQETRASLYTNHDNDLLLSVKRLIRASQAKMAVLSLGLKNAKIFYLDLPFYYTRSKVPGQEDYAIVKSLFNTVEPDIVFAAGMEFYRNGDGIRVFFSWRCKIILQTYEMRETNVAIIFTVFINETLISQQHFTGDLTDPHGTHRICLQIILKLKALDDEAISQNPVHMPLFPSPQNILFYRGAWQQWDLATVKRIVPMSPEEAKAKIASILKHQSQKDFPKYPGDDTRQFWERSKARNRETANKLKGLGLPDYEAAECFVDLNGLLNYDQL